MGFWRRILVLAQLLGSRFRAQRCRAKFRGREIGLPIRPKQLAESSRRLPSPERHAKTHALHFYTGTFSRFCQLPVDRLRSWQGSMRGSTAATQTARIWSRSGDPGQAASSAQVQAVSRRPCGALPAPWRPADALTVAPWPAGDAMLIDPHGRLRCNGRRMTGRREHAPQVAPLEVSAVSAHFSGFPGPYRRLALCTCTYYCIATVQFLYGDMETRVFGRTGRTPRSA
jgi:hypothetical protein